MKPHNLPDAPEQSPILLMWLRKATRGLCPEAAERVTREISEHFASAVLERMAQGESQTAAEAVALQALGGPRAARRKLLKSDLSMHEAWIVAALTNTPSFGVKLRLHGKHRHFGQILGLGAMFFAGGISAIAAFNVNDSQGPPRLIAQALMSWVVLSSLLVMTMPVVLPPLRTGVDLQEFLVPRLRRLAQIQAGICVLITLLVCIGFIMYFLLDAQPRDAELRALILVQSYLNFVMLASAVWMVSITLRTIEKLSRRDGPTQG